jgi:hypothetical protein
VPDSIPPVFIDRNSGGRTFRKILESAGIKVVLHDELFSQTTSDPAWLKKVANLGYIMVTGDKQTTRQLLFLKQLSDSNAFVFILYGLNGASPQGKAGCILSAMDKIRRLMETEKPPGIWKIAKDNQSAQKCDHEQILQRMYARRSE